MGIKCECDCDINFRFKHNRFIIAIFLTCGFTLSFLSDLDCFFVRVDLDSVPDDALFDTTTFGIGLWSFEDPDERSKCISPGALNTKGSITPDDQLYSRIWLNGDAYWSAARIIAVVGLVVGFTTVIFVWICLCSKRNKDNKHELDIVIATTTLALGCEGTKFGLFFDTKPCTDNMWKHTNMEGVINSEKAATCLLSRGTYMSCVCLLLYLLMIIYQILVRAFPAYDHTESEGLDYDDVTLPSFLGSIGKSVTSKVSKTSSAVGSAVSGFSGFGVPRFNRDPSSVAYNSGHGGVSQIMEPIIEGEYDEEDEYSNSRRSLTSRGSRNSRTSGNTGPSSR